MRIPCLIAAVITFHGAIGTGVAAESSAAPAATVPHNRLSVLTAEQVVQILDETVDWYRTLGTQQQNANQPSDLLILFANRQTADEVVGFAFDIARANAELLSSEVSTERSAAEGSSLRALNLQQSQLDAKRQTIQQQLTAAKQRLGAGNKTNPETERQLSELQGELAMVDAQKNLLDTASDFVDENDTKIAGANALKAQIDAIAATVPTSDTKPAPSSGSNAPASPSTSTAASTARDAARPPPTRQGIWDLAADVFKLRTKIDTIGVIDRHTAALAATFEKLSVPARAQLTSYSARSDALAAEADHASGQALVALRGEFDTLAWLFKQTSAILLPLSNEQVLLARYRHNLGNWKDATLRQYHEAMTVLAKRVALLIGMLMVLFILGELWRRLVLRYVPDARRRYQWLLIRKLVLTTLVIGVVGLSVVSEISSFMTFAGLLTAGVAVAMQSVLLSLVGYFLLIGKFGIRVGDRVQIGTVVGEVIQLGLIRIHLMELNTAGALGPTGRVVAFANQIVFQASSGLFKQIPGVNLAWHENTVVLPRVSDYAALKQQMLTAISRIVDDYRDEFVRQNKAIEASTASAVDDVLPQVHMHLAGERMEALIRYPVSLQHAGQIDERVSEAVLKIIAPE